ncbi:hypothetical protein Ahy_B05g079549 isoform D [Arachis hypogaea]|uniref:Uncharacterized protein n=1 Tax=Arachis hypogaea TaxID=3818 RepID=A0A444ZA57_ARAHY|nr:hypothetical protein Ahy_B05g079549 isoform D [Arachis hypogaea]
MRRKKINKQQTVKMEKLASDKEQVEVHAPCRVSYGHVFARVGKLIRFISTHVRVFQSLEPNQLHFHKYNKIGTGE